MIQQLDELEEELDQLIESRRALVDAKENPVGRTRPTLSNRLEQT